MDEDIEDVKAKLNEMTKRMKAWRNAFFVSVAMFVALCIELMFDFV